MKHSLAEAEELLDDLRSKNQKMFLDNIIIMVTAKDKEELEANTEAIEAVVRKHICSLSILKYQQEKGLQSVLPLGNCTLKIRRTLTTESTAVLMPFSGKEINHKNGKYYGLNALSNNMITHITLQIFFTDPFHGISSSRISGFVRNSKLGRTVKGLLHPQSKKKSLANPERYS